MADRKWAKTVGTAVSVGIVGVGIGLGVYAGGTVFGGTSQAGAGKVAHVSEAAPKVAALRTAAHVSRPMRKVAVARRVGTKPGAPYVVTTEILTGAMDHLKAPEYSPGFFSLPANATVEMTVRSYDNGPAPAPGYTTIRGTVGSVMEVNGKTVRKVAANDITHTFTVPALGLSVPIPAARAGKYVTVRFEFHTGAKGTYTWQCYAQCGSGPSGWGYPMTTQGMMTGTITVR